MKKANILRILAIVAVLVMASMTAGCLSSKIEVKYGGTTIDVEQGVALTGKFTFTLTGWLAGGIYDTLQVAWMAGEDPIAPATGESYLFTDFSVPIHPLQKTGELDIADLEILPTESLEAPGAPELTEVWFTFTGTGLGLPELIVKVPVASF